MDLDQNILDGATARITKSLARVAKKKFGDDTDGAKAFVESTMGSISTATDACKFAGLICGKCMLYNIHKYNVSFFKRKADFTGKLNIFWLQSSNCEKLRSPI